MPKRTSSQLQHPQLVIKNGQGFDDVNCRDNQHKPFLSKDICHRLFQISLQITQPILYRQLRWFLRLRYLNWL